MSDRYERLRARCPQMWGMCQFDLPGGGWYNLLAGLTDTVSTYVEDGRVLRLKAQRYNRALRRSVATGNGWPIYHQLWQSDRADSLLTPKYGRPILETVAERERVVGELIVNPVYKPVEPVPLWPKIRRVHEIGARTQPLMFEVASDMPTGTHRSVLMSMLLYTRNLSARVCKFCGASLGIEPRGEQSIGPFLGQPMWSIAVCTECQYEIEYDGHIHDVWVPDANEYDLRKDDEEDV